MGTTLGDLQEELDRNLKALVPGRFARWALWQAARVVGWVVG
jgi:hypothetical protein